MLSRRQFLKGVVAAGATAMVVDGFLLDPRRIAIIEKTVPIHGLPEAFEGFRICQLTDIHHGFFVNIEYIKECIAKANNLMPDIMVLTGDYIDRSSAYINPVADALGRLEAPYGVLAVLGNHDHWADVKLVRKAFHDKDIPVIENTHRLIEKDGDVICIAGVGDLLEDIQDLQLALNGVSPDIPRVLLSHHPDYAEEMQRTERVDLVLAGNTHGGQISMPFSFAPYTASRYGQKYIGGLVKLEHTQVYVSRGIGVAPPPVRFNCSPEITMIKLIRAFT